MGKAGQGSADSLAVVLCIRSSPNGWPTPSCRFLSFACLPPAPELCCRQWLERASPIRYRWLLTWDERPEVVMIECREHPRIPIDLQVFFSTADNADIRQGTMFDVSAGGCAVTSSVPLRPGIGVRLFIRATALGSAITVQSAAVRWAKHGEFGVEFLSLSELDRHRLHRLLNVAAPQSPRPN